MKGTLIIVLLLVGICVGFSQGTILFDTHVSGIVDARVVSSGSLVGWSAQLLFRAEAAFEFTPVLPITTFNTAGSAADVGYVNPITVQVDGSPPGSKGTVLFKVIRPEPCLPIYAGQALITLGGGGNAPAYLEGVSGVYTDEVACVPEPGTIAFGFLLLALWGVRRGKPPIVS